MKLTHVKVRNYRMLHDIDVGLEDDVTLIVGKNNCGKTSFFEVIKSMVTDDRKLSFEDFSQKSYSDFSAAQKIHEEYYTASDDESKLEILNRLQKQNPKIELQLKIEYEKSHDTLVELSEFITDLDETRHDATILIVFECINTINLYNAYKARKDQNQSLLKFLNENVDVFYKTNCYALDPLSGNRRLIDSSYKYKILRVVSFEEIRALRVLDDIKGDKYNTLGLGFAKYYKQRDKTKEDVEKLEEKLKEVGRDLKEKYKVILDGILADLKKFGAETPIVIPDIEIDSIFDSEAVIKNNIRYLYKQDEIDLPENYNGLGYSNLIYMILEFASFIEKHKNATKEKVSQFLVVMIEEPEAHMHPQMQQVFIRQIEKLLIDAKKHNITVQLVITSHSSHIISEAGINLKHGFNRVRYFLKRTNDVICKDFNSLKLDNDENAFRFLKQYLNLHKSDLFFADKVIMVEGVTERLLMPQMISKVAPSLQNEYITVLEVGGAYTHKFKEILTFIGVQTLLITDLDTIDATTREISQTDIGNLTQETSNETLRQWLPKKTLISELLACAEEDKIHNDHIRVAFQVAELNATYYSRSFEESFIECNKEMFIKEVSFNENGKSVSKKIKNEFALFRAKTSETLAVESSFVLSPQSSKVKTNFAFDVMTFNEKIFGQWKVPYYIKEGLEWLAGRCIINSENL